MKKLLNITKRYPTSSSKCTVTAINECKKDSISNPRQHLLNFSHGESENCEVYSKKQYFSRIKCPGEKTRPSGETQRLFRHCPLNLHNSSTHNRAK